MQQRTVPLSKKFTIEQIVSMIDSGHAYYLPFGINKKAYMVVNNKPNMVVVSDISIFSINLNGSWYTWEELENLGGLYESEFDALSAVAAKMQP
ncbi:MAG: hypothetical protein K6A23_12245 [Butyrivibrio sp.]|nr:hypothetical protein [Butyrivibrio sp.]